MKSLLNLLTFFVLAFASSAHAAPRLGFDGCFQLYAPGSMYPAFCLQGTAEEGINGAGVRLAIFGTNTADVIKCAVSSASGMTRTSFSYSLNGNVELTLKNVRLESGKKSGDAILGKTRLKFSQLSDRDTDRLIRIANTSCQGN